MELKSKKNILVLGAKWMLWNSIFSYLKRNNFFNVYWTSSKIELGYIDFLLDYNYINKLENLFNENKFDYIINCIWSIRPDKDLDSYEKTLLINSHFPKTLQNLSKKYNFKLIHFSTDCVFNWINWDYLIDDIPNEFWLYWLSKYLWEIDDNKNLTIRTSIIWIELWHNSKNLLNWFLSNKNWSKIFWYSNVFRNWVTTLTLAKIINYIILENINLTWLIQLWWEKISKYDLLLLFKNIFRKNILIEEKKDIYIDKTIISNLNNNTINSFIIPIKEQIIELKSFYNL